MLYAMRRPSGSSLARARDLAGLPPTFIGVGALDLFLDENGLCAAADARRSSCTYPGAFHGFQMVGSARVTAQAERDYEAAAARFLNG